MREHVNDIYVKRAKSEGYRSRAAYKLIEIAERHRLLQPGSCVVDLGAAPGGWSQVAAARVGRRGKVIAVDLIALEPIGGVDFIQGDFADPKVMEYLRARLQAQPPDLVMSDISPNISGIAIADQPQMIGLAELALDFACRQLKPGGDLLVKLFQGRGFEGFLREMRACFDQVMTRKPEASRGRSNEIYLLGRRRCRPVTTLTSPRK